VHGESQSKRCSQKPPWFSCRRELTLTVCGFTAGGSGVASREAITINAPSTHIVHETNFIPACAPHVNDNGFLGSTFRF
jgi:hypothetical protein